MNTNDVKKMISIFYDMELNNYMMQNCINKIRDKMSELKIERHIPEPIFNVDYFEPEKSDSYSIKKYSEIIGIILGLLLGLLTGCEHGKGSSGLDVIITVPIGLIVGGTIGYLGGLIIGFIIDSINQDKIETENQKRKAELNKQAQARYEKAMSVYKKACDDEKERLMREGETYRRFEINRENLRLQLESSKESLNKLYDEAHIETPYRNLIAMGYMNELVTIEAATQLKGADGLYYLVRKELRMDNLENILNGISEKIDTIISQNNRLHSEIVRMNTNSTNLCNDVIREIKANTETQRQVESIVKGIDKNTKASSCSNAITAYNTERLRKEMEYQKFMRNIR